MDHFGDAETFLRKMKNNPEKQMADISEKMMEKRCHGGNWLPYFNAWYVICDGVICSN